MLVRPVKLGIRNDLYAQSAISHRRIAAALRTYCNSVGYLKASVEGAVRVDLAGQPAGAVTATEAHRARGALAAIAKASAKGGSKVASPQSGPKVPEGARMGQPSRPPAAPEGCNREPSSTAKAPTPAPKRLSLRDLKLAAAARKTNRGS
jgi:ProP effector